MDSSHLSRLSPELRNQIYEYALVSTLPLPLGALEIRLYSGLTHTCRQIRSETQSMFYTLNTFSIQLYHSHISSFCAFLRALGPDLISQLRCMQLRIVQLIPWPSNTGSLQCAQNIEIRGLTQNLVDVGAGKFYDIGPSGVETEVLQTLRAMGLSVKGRGSTWYSGAKWFVGFGNEGGAVGALK